MLRLSVKDSNHSSFQWAKISTPNLEPQCARLHHSNPEVVLSDFIVGIYFSSSMIKHCWLCPFQIHLSVRPTFIALLLTFSSGHFRHRLSGAKRSINALMWVTSHCFWSPLPAFWQALFLPSNLSLHWHHLVLSHGFHRWYPRRWFDRSVR